MSKLLNIAIAKLRELPDDRQDEAAELLLSLVGRDEESVQLSAEQIAETRRRLAEPAEHVSHADVRALFQN